MNQADPIDALADTLFGAIDARIKAAEARMAAAVEARIAALPSPEAGPPGKDGAPGERGADGIGTNGQDGQAGRDGRDGKDGADGRDAIDGLIDIEADLVERDLAITFVRSNGVRTTLRKALPIPIYRGVHQDRQPYERGDNVTKGGCQWTCVRDTTSSPPSADWVQSTKAGRDGRDK